MNVNWFLPQYEITLNEIILNHNSFPLIEMNLNYFLPQYEIILDI